MFDKTVLDNGLRVVSSSLPHTRSVSISIFIGAGSRYESDDIAGVSHFLEHMLFKGTKRRPTAREISEEIWPHQPLGRDTGGTPESVRAITRDDVVRYMGQLYVPQNTVVAVAGNVSHEEVVNRVGQ